MQYFNIQVASQLSGVASATIRAWEKRYNAVVPERADNKHRLYSDKDIEKLAVLYRLTEIGQSIGKIAHLELEKLKEIYTSLLHKPYNEVQIVTPNHERLIFNDVIGNLLIALREYRIEILAHELDKAFSIMTPKEICLDLLTPLYQRVSDKLLSEEFKISHKKTLDELVVFYIGQLVGRYYQQSSFKDELVIIFSPDNNEREMHLYLSTLLLIQCEYKFLFLGTNISIETLAEVTNNLNPKMIIVCTNESVSFADYLSEIQSNIKTTPQIIFAGDIEDVTKKEIHQKNGIAVSEMAELYKVLTVN